MTVPRVVFGKFYRHPYYKQSHAARDDGVYEAACGRPLWFDGHYWFESGLEGKWGEQKLDEETRKTGPCGTCKTNLKKLALARQARPKPVPPPKSPYDEAGRAQAQQLVRVDTMRRRTLAALVIRELGGEIVSESEVLHDG